MSRAGNDAKGWCLGPWNSTAAVCVGYATAAVHEPHVHQRIREIYLVARGSARRHVDGHVIDLSPGDVVMVEPGERHTLTDSTPDYLHFVVHDWAEQSGVPRDKASA
ncbi:MAG: cupin domain-containing protein [Candidatus Latescibacterota bacterium]